MSNVKKVAIVGVVLVAGALGLGYGWSQRAADRTKAVAVADAPEPRHQQQASEPAVRKPASSEQKAEAAPPRFTNPPPALETDPASPNYDTARLIRALRTASAAKEIFEAEPRTEPFATEVQSRIESRLREELRLRAPKAEIKAVECRTLSCRAELRLPPSLTEQERGLALSALQIPPLGPTQKSVPSGDPNLVVQYSFFEKQMKDPAEYDKWYRSTRERVVEAAKQSPPVPGIVFADMK
jgi:hypothetical protein